MFDEHVETFMGETVRNFDADEGLDPEHRVWRIGLDWESHEQGANVIALFEQLAADPHADVVRGLVIGAWDPK